MKKLLSIILSLCLLVCLLPTFAFAVPATATGISKQNAEVYSGSPATFTGVFTVYFNVLDEYPEGVLAANFNGLNGEMDISGITVTFSIVQNESGIIGVGNVSVSADVLPGVYYFLAFYDGLPISPTEGDSQYSKLTVSEPQAPPEPEDPALSDAGRSLSLSDIVYINAYAKIVGTEVYTPEYIRANGGLLVFTQTVSEENATYENASSSGYIQPGLIGGTDNEYAQRTRGITSLQYRDTYYLRIYLKLQDGSYLYTPLKTYGVHVYCQNKINSEKASQQLKDVCQKLLAYGDAASTYFNAGGTTGSGETE